jgi:hypothetical protein
MSDDCRNDCAEPVAFPKQPNNRPGLDKIDYRIGAYPDFRDYLLGRLDRAPQLQHWTHRGADDPGIALLEGAAILGDILSFYQDRYANEAYLRTATWRDSVADLVRLLGYRLSPGLGGRGTFAFEVKGDKPVRVPAGFPLTAQVEGLEDPADFMTAYPWLGRFNLYRRLHTPYITSATKDFVVWDPDPAIEPIEIIAGDRLLIGIADSSSNPTALSDPEIVVIDSVRELHGRKIYTIKGELQYSGSSFQMAAVKLGRSFRHFGHNAPRKLITLGSGGTASEATISYVRYLDQTTPPATTSDTYVVDPALAPSDFPLSSEVDDLALGAHVVIQGRFLGTTSGGGEISLRHTHLRTIAEVKARSMTWGALTGATTLVTVPSQVIVAGGGVYYHRADIREMEIHEVVGPVMTLRSAPEPTSAATGHYLYFCGTDAQVQSLDGRSLLLVKPDQEPVLATVQSVQSLSASVADRSLLRRVTLDVEVTYADYPHQDPSVTVFGNLVEATQGKAEREVVLGNGDARQVFQTFKLPKAPLTYLIDAGQTPPEAPELEVFVSDRLWTRVASLFAKGPKEEIYIVREDAKGESWVQFGDGKTGARLPSGVKNVVAHYRSGQGAFGALKTDTKVQPKGKLDRLDKVRLPGVASGGAQPESGDKARQAAPGKIQSLDRLVSLGDFESETLAIPAGRSTTTCRLWC